MEITDHLSGPAEPGPKRAAPDPVVLYFYWLSWDMTQKSMLRIETKHCTCSQRRRYINIGHLTARILICQASMRLPYIKKDDYRMNNRTFKYTKDFGGCSAICLCCHRITSNETELQAGESSQKVSTWNLFKPFRTDCYMSLSWCPAPFAYLTMKWFSYYFTEFLLRLGSMFTP